MGTSSQNYIKEKDIDNNAISIPISALKVISDIGNKCICKIKVNINVVATGFFCLIPFPNKLQRLPVMITNNHVLESEDIIIGKKINFSINNDKISFEIVIDNKRRVYTNEEDDITIIEIINSDNLKEDSFLDIDDQIFNNNYHEIYNKKSVYLLHYPHGNNSEYSSGIIKSISLDKNCIKHSCQSQSGSSGGPIINLITHKVIGVHKGSPSNNDNCNLATFLKTVIENFNKKMKEVNENQNNISIDLSQYKAFIKKYDEEDENDFKNIQKNYENDLEIYKNNFGKDLKIYQNILSESLEDKIILFVNQNSNNENLKENLNFYKCLYEKKKKI